MGETSKKPESDGIFDKTRFADRHTKSIDQNWRPESDKLDLVRVAKSISRGSVQHSADDYSDSLVGHNQGPPLDEVEADADTDTKRGRSRRISGSKLTPEALTWLRAREKSGEVEKVIRDSPYGSDVVDNFERRRIGPSRDGRSGKWRNPDGLVSRRGYRRIAPDDKQWLDENNIETLQEIAKQILHGRNATIFEKMVINPLVDGVRRPPVENIAAQFNITPKRIYKILDRCRDMISRARIRFEQTPENRSAVCQPRPVRRAMPIPLETIKQWIKQEDEDEARWRQRWRDYVKAVMDKWESVYGVDRPYGPKSKVK